MEVDIHKDQGRIVKLKASGMTSTHFKRLSGSAIEKTPMIGEWISQFPAENRNAAKYLLMKLRFVTRDDYSNWLMRALESLSDNELCALYAVRKAEKKKAEEKVKKIDCLWDDKGNVVNRPGTTLRFHNMSNGWDLVPGQFFPPLPGRA